MIREIERRTHKPIDPLKIDVVHRSEPEIKKVTPGQNVPLTDEHPRREERPHRPAPRTSGQQTRHGHVTRSDGGRPRY